MYLEKLWPRCRFARGSNDRIEPFHMPDLQYTIMFVSGIDQGLRPFDRSRNWFFNEYIDAVFEQIDADSSMIDCRNRQADRIHFAKNVPVIGKCRSLVKSRDFFGTRFENVDYTDKLRIRKI